MLKSGIGLVKKGRTLDTHFSTVAKVSTLKNNCNLQEKRKEIFFLDQLCLIDVQIVYRKGIRRGGYFCDKYRDLLHLINTSGFFSNIDKKEL